MELWRAGPRDTREWAASAGTRAVTCKALRSKLVSARLGQMCLPSSWLLARACDTSRAAEHADATTWMRAMNQQLNFHASDVDASSWAGMWPKRMHADVAFATSSSRRCTRWSLHSLDGLGGYSRAAGQHCSNLRHPLKVLPQHALWWRSCSPRLSASVEGEPALPWCDVKLCVGSHRTPRLRRPYAGTSATSLRARLMAFRLLCRERRHGQCSITTMHKSRRLAKPCRG